MADGFQPKFVDLVRNFTTTTGFDDFVIGPAVNGFASFTDACAVGDSFYYSAIGIDNPADTEVGRGTLLAGGVIARDPISGKKTNFKSGTKSIALVAAAEWFVATDAARSGAGPTNVKSFGAAGDGAADDTAAIQAALDHVATIGGGALYFPEGVYVVSSFLTVHPRTLLRGAGRLSTVITSAYGGGGGADAGEDLRNGSVLVTTAPINASTPIHVVIEDIGIENTNAANVGAAYYDRGGTYISCRNCSFGGFRYGVVLDQSELVDIDLCEIGGQNDGGAAVWIVNGPQLTAGVSAGYSNRISVKRCQINQYPTAYGIRDDGGAAHVFEDNNYNGCLNHIYATAVYPLDIRGGEFESASGHCIRLESINPDGVILGACFSAIRGGVFAATSGNAAICSSTSGGMLQVDGSPQFSGGGGTTFPIVGCGNFSGLWLLSYANTTPMSAVRDGNAQGVTIDLGSPDAMVNGVALGGGIVTAANIGSAAAHDETDFMQAPNNLGEIQDGIAAAKNLGTGVVLAGSAVQASHTGDTAEFTLATVTIPAGAIGANGRVVVEADVSFAGTGGVKTTNIYFGSQLFVGHTAGTGESARPTRMRITNRGNPASQRWDADTISLSSSQAKGFNGTGSLDTSVEQTLAIKGQLGSATDTITLESYQVTLFPKE
jgi:hypothetical protein